MDGATGGVTWAAARRAPRRRPQILLSALLASLLLAALAAANASAAAQPAIQQWRQSIRVLALPSAGCFHASYPHVQWHAVACKTAPDHPYLPARRSLLQEIGDGDDYSAEVSGLITSAIGSFSSVSAGASETGLNPYTEESEANALSLQLNSNFFSTPMCAKHGSPSLCQGWQQFVYADSSEESEVFMQYWLIQYNNICPSGWFEFKFEFSTETYCYENSESSELPGGRLTVSGLAGTTLEGSADVGGKDAVVMTTESGNATATGAANVLSLDHGWKAAEFAVLGDGDGSQATFSANTTITVQTVVKSKSDVRPTCVNEGFTGETNNLSFEETPALSTQPFPTIASQQTNGSASGASCATAGAGALAETRAPSEVTQTSGSLHAVVNPEGVKVSGCKFEYGTTTKYGSSVACAKLPGSGSSAVEVSAALKTLKPSTDYHYRIAASDSAGTSHGAGESFLSAPKLPPEVTTGLAGDVTSSTATLAGFVNPMLGQVTKCVFEYGTTTKYGSSVACAKLPGSGSSAVEVSAAIKGLKANETYHFRVSAANEAGTVKGDDESLKTT